MRSNELSVVDADGLGRCTTRLNHSERIGLTLIAVSSLASLTLILALFVLFIRNLLRFIKSRHESDSKLYWGHINAYFISLLLGDIFQAIGGIMNLKWVQEERSVCGAFCDAQGALQQIGEDAVAFSTMWIAIITFVVIFFQWAPSKHSWIATILLSLSWLFMLLEVVIGWALHKGTSDSDESRYYTPAPYWCYLGDHYMAERIGIGYFWLWLAAGVSIVLYTLLFFRIRGNILVAPSKFPKIRITFRRLPPSSITDDDASSTYSEPPRKKSSSPIDGQYISNESTVDALKMLSYPICYCFIITPLSVVRWITFSGHTPPFAATAAAVFIFKTSGLTNVILFMYTRPSLLLFRRRGAMERKRSVTREGVEEGVVPAGAQMELEDAKGTIHARHDSEGTGTGAETMDEPTEFHHRHQHTQNQPGSPFNDPPVYPPPQPPPTLPPLDFTRYPPTPTTGTRLIPAPSEDGDRSTTPTTTYRSTDHLRPSKRGADGLDRPSTGSSSRYSYPSTTAVTSTDFYRGSKKDHELDIEYQKYKQQLEGEDEDDILSDVQVLEETLDQGSPVPLENMDYISTPTSAFPMASSAYARKGKTTRDQVH